MLKSNESTEPIFTIYYDSGIYGQKNGRFRTEKVRNIRPDEIKTEKIIISDRAGAREIEYLGPILIDPAVRASLI